MATRYDQLDPTVQAAVQTKYADRELKRWTRFVPETIELGTLECPAAFYYRKTTEEDTTPVGIVGVKLLKSGSIQDTGSSRFRNFELKTKVPPLLPGKEPEQGSIYEMLGVQFPAIDDGWPGETTDSDERIFDSTTVLLSPDSPIDLSMLSAYEQRYEAERDAGGSGAPSPRLKVPPVGTRIGYMGYWIEHAWFDAAVGPELTNREMAFTGGVHKYNMGKLETPFYEEGVLRALCYYPQQGVMRRKLVVPGEQPIASDFVVSSINTYPRYNQNQASYDRVFHFEVEAGPEGAILSGRWCPLEEIGSGSLDAVPGQEGIVEAIFEMILETIRKGGSPLRYFPGTRFALPKWNQFWSTTSDGWIFGGNPPPGTPGDYSIDPDGGITAGGGLTEMIQQPVSSASEQGASGALVPVRLFGNTQVEFENEKASMAEILHAPQPSYNDNHDEEFGFIGGA